MFNPRLAGASSRRVPNVSVQFSRNRCRPAAGPRILTTSPAAVKRKNERPFIFLCGRRRKDRPDPVRAKQNTPEDRSGQELSRPVRPALSARFLVPSGQSAASKNSPGSTGDQEGRSGITVLSRVFHRPERKNAQGLKNSNGSGWTERSRSEGVFVPRSNRASCAR